MLSEIRVKIRALVPDLSKNDFETFVYQSGDTIFILSESNINSILKITKNGTELGTGEYSYDSTNNEVEILVALSANDVIIVKYNYYKYSNTELNEYIRASLVWISIFGSCSEDYELEDDDIVPTPCNMHTDLIALISAILIQPDYTSYRLPNIQVTYSRKMPKEERIKRLIMKVTTSGIGVNDVLTFYYSFD